MQIIGNSLVLGLSMLICTEYTIKQANIEK